MNNLSGYLKHQTIQDIAKQIVGACQENNETKKHQQILYLAEEVEEFIGAARKYLGLARRGSSFDDVREELADVVITSYATAEVFNINLDYEMGNKIEKILARGWRESV